jgi:hypothetical protein
MVHENDYLSFSMDFVIDIEIIDFYNRHGLLLEF